MERTSLSSACLSVGLKWISVWNAMYVCMYACMQWHVVRGAFLSSSICIYRNLGGAFSQAHDRLVLSTHRLSGPIWMTTLGSPGL